MGKIIRLDNSRVQAINSCQTQTVVEFIHGYQSQKLPHPMVGGKHGHVAMQVYIESGGDGVSAMSVFEALHKPYSAEHRLQEDEKHVQWSYENMRDVLEYYFQHYTLDRFPFTYVPGSCEDPVVATLAADVEGWAKLDALAREKELGGLYPVDHKFRGSRVTHWWLQKFKRGSQPTTYIWAAAKKTGEVVPGMYINIIDVGKLPEIKYTKAGAPYKCKTHSCPVTECRALHSQHQLKLVSRTPSMIKEWERLALRSAYLYAEWERDFESIEQVQGAQTEGVANGSCNFCQFADWCNMGREPGMVESMLVHSPWEPWNE